MVDRMFTFYLIQLLILQCCGNCYDEISEKGAIESRGERILVRAINIMVFFGERKTTITLRLMVYRNKFYRKYACNEATSKKIFK